MISTYSVQLIKKIICFLFFFLFLNSGIYSQKQADQLKFQRFGIEQGLSVTTAFSIIQGENGFLWVATIDGLQRYDGYNFFPYKNNFNDSSSISDNTVSCLAKGSSNVIWVGTFSGGLNRLDGRTGKFIRIQHDPDDNNSLSSNRIWAIYEDNAGVVWVGTDNGLNRIDPDSQKITRYFHDEANSKSICDNSILSIHKDKKGILWIGTTNGLSRASQEKSTVLNFTNYTSISGDPRSLCSNIVMSLKEAIDGVMWIGTSDGLNKFDPENDHFRCIQFSGKPGIVSKQVYSYLNSYGENAIRAMYEDKNKCLWLATDKGLKIFDPVTEKVNAYQSVQNDPTSLSTDLLYSFCEDLSGNLWIGTMVGGLNKVDLKPKKFALYQTQNGNPFGLSSNNIRSVFLDSKNTLWVGTLEGGLNRMNEKTGKFERIRNKDFDAENVWTIQEDRKGTMWFGTSTGLYSYDREKDKFRQFKTVKDDAESISDNIIRSILEDSKGFLWVGTEGGLNMLDPETGKFKRFVNDNKNKNSLSHNTVWTIGETNGTIWAGTDNGLNKLTFDKETNTYSFKHYFPQQENENSISNRSVRSILIDRGGIMWIATSNGLNKFDYKLELFTRYNEGDGLANSYTYGVLGDKSDHIWISTNSGISRFNKTNGEFKNYDKLDGLQNNEFNTGAFYCSKNAELFFGGPDGFNRFFPDSLYENKTPPPVVITSIKVFGSELANEKQPFEISDIRLNYDENVISFEFAALDFTVPEKNQYIYILEGFDKNWIKAGTRRFVNYTNLDPGEYHFKVRASNNDGTWNNEGVTIHLTIVPPIWKTLWFRVLVIVFLVAAVYAYFRRRISRFKKNQELLQEQVFLKTKELRKEKEIVEKQNSVIEKKNNNITSSIRYAKRIQDSILPLKEKLNEIIPESFIFFKPKDIVSGDFYWFTKQNDKILIAAVDCTGHGVPGAFMSLIGNNLLNDIVKNQKIADPAEILRKVHEGLVLALKKGEQESDTVDGMDITLCVIDPKSNSVEFSSTGRPLILIRKNELKKYRIGKHPLGLITKKELRFENERIYLENNDTFYIFTDGYCDQFGEADDEKFLDLNFEKLLLKIQEQEMSKQSKILETEIETWKGKNAQIDDMLVIGIRYTSLA